MTPPEKRLTNDEIRDILQDAENVVNNAHLDADLWPVAFARVLDYKFQNAHFDKVGGQE